MHGPKPRLVLFVLLLATAIAMARRPLRANPPPGDDAAVATEIGLAPADQVNLERNLRWMLSRERAASARRPAAASAKAGRRAGVYADAGAWHLGARSMTTALEGAGWTVRVLDRSLLRDDVLADLDALVLPGGWAPFQRDAAGAEGLAAVKHFVEKGGRAFGVCAGGYLLSREVRWEGETHPYPVGLFDGVADGPVAGLAPWPQCGPVRLSVTPSGAARGLKGLTARDITYYGGSRFTGGTGITVLATYPDGTAAVIARSVGKGEIVLSGVHPERDPATALDAAAAVPADAGALLAALLGD